MDDECRRLNILLKIYFAYIKFKLIMNSKRNTMHTYILSNDNNVKKLKDVFEKEGYYISNYRPYIYLVHPILYDE